MNIRLLSEAVKKIILFVFFTIHSEQIITFEFKISLNNLSLLNFFDLKMYQSKTSRYNPACQISVV